MRLAGGDSPAPLRPGRGRRPEAEVRASILDAAGRMLVDEGMAAFTIDGVAARSGTSKTTIYKWWSSKGALALDGFFDLVRPTLVFHDSGHIREDLCQQLKAFTHLAGHTPTGKVLRELVGQAQLDPDLDAALKFYYTEPRRQLAVDAIVRGQKRGQLVDDLDAEAVVSQLWGAVYHRLLITDLPLDDAFAESLVNQILEGVRLRR